MKRIIIIVCLCLPGLLIQPSCKKDSTDPNLPALQLTPEKVMAKTGQVSTATLLIHAPYGVKKLETYKTVNLVTSGGVNTVATEDLGNDNFRYVFNYTHLPDEVDKLVGINFHFEDSKGNAAEKDLTVYTEASGAQKIYSRTWKLTSKLWTTRKPAPEESLQDCEKDNKTRFKPDSSILLDYGASGCLFDGFNIFDKWWLSDDEKIFTQVYHSVFDPTKITVERYTVKSLTSEKMVLEIALDLSAFGLGKEEMFLFTYEAV